MELRACGLRIDRRQYKSVIVDKVCADLCHFSIHKTFSCQEDNNQLKVKRKGDKFLVQSFAGNLGYKKGEKQLFLKGGVFFLGSWC